jgi:hypothetical protein
VLDSDSDDWLGYRSLIFYTVLNHHLNMKWSTIIEVLVSFFNC